MTARHCCLIAIGLGSLLPSLGQAQVASLRSMEGGYENGRQIETQAFNPSSRDLNGNRLVVNGIIQSGDKTSNYTSSDSTASGLFSQAPSSAQGSVIALGNLLSVSINGNNNTVVLNSRQKNNGSVSAVLNGKRESGQ